MPRGDIFEPIFEIAARIFFPRGASSSVWDVVSWPWLISLCLSLIVLAMFKAGYWKKGDDRPRTKGIVALLWASVFYALVMFRFAKGVF